MASSKEIKTRISSTKKTKKITSAMKLVSAAKLSKLQKQLQNTRPYSSRLKKIFVEFREALDRDEIENYPLLQEPKELKTVLILVISSDRGLCGGYNNNIIKTTTKRINELLLENKIVKLVTVGRKLSQAFSKAVWKGKIEILKTFSNLAPVPTSSEANVISRFISQSFINKKADRVELISTRFINMVSNEIVQEVFLPVTKQQEEGINHSSDPYTIFEPDVKILINTLAPMFVNNVIYSKLIETSTSEQAARMTAMSNATNNAEEVIHKLLLVYNKARQASITQEISEIVGGSAAV
jgi:F-type H+-transporting ATPase subunit gamma